MLQSYELKSMFFSGNATLARAANEIHAAIGAGASGDFVASIQSALVSLGYELPQFGVDGYFGDETTNAILQFQRDHGLSVDGIVGMETLRMMDALLPSGFVWIPSGPDGIPSSGMTVSTPSGGNVPAGGYGGRDYRNKEAIMHAFGQSGGFQTGFDFYSEQSWEQYKEKEERNPDPKAASSSGETNQYSMFYVNDDITPENFVNLMLGRFIFGVGPENFVFPLNGQVSREMAGADIVQTIVNEWYVENYEAILSGRALRTVRGLGDFGFSEQVSLLWNQRGSITNVPQFVGSAMVTIEPQVTIAPEPNNLFYDDPTELLVTVRNVTSATSGDLLKHFWIFGAAPSYPKDTLYPAWQQFTNTSQVFQFTLPISRSRAMFLRQKQKWSEETR